MGIDIGVLGNAWFDARDARIAGEKKGALEERKLSLQEQNLEIAKGKLKQTVAASNEKILANIRKAAGEFYKNVGSYGPLFDITAAFTPSEIRKAIAAGMKFNQVDAKVKGYPFLTILPNNIPEAKKHDETTHKNLREGSVPITSLRREDVPAALSKTFKLGSFSQNAAAFNATRLSHLNTADLARQNEYVTKTANPQGLVNIKRLIGERGTPLGKYVALDMNTQGLKNEVTRYTGLFGEKAINSAIKKEPRILPYLNFKRLESRYQEILDGRNVQEIRAFSKILKQKQPEFANLVLSSKKALRVSIKREKDSASESYNFVNYETDLPNLSRLFGYKHKATKITPIELSKPDVLARELDIKDPIYADAFLSQGLITITDEEARNSSPKKEATVQGYTGPNQKLASDDSQTGTSAIVNRNEVNSKTEILKNQKRPNSGSVNFEDQPWLLKIVDSNGKRLPAPLEADFTKPNHFHFAIADLWLDKFPEYKKYEQNRILLDRVKPLTSALKKLDTLSTNVVDNETNYKAAILAMRNRYPDISFKEARKLVDNAMILRKMVPNMQEPLPNNFNSFVQPGPITRRTGDQLEEHEKQALKGATSIKNKAEVLQGHVNQFKDAVRTIGIAVGVDNVDGQTRQAMSAILKELRKRPDEWNAILDEAYKTKRITLDEYKSIKDEAFDEGIKNTGPLYTAATKFIGIWEELKGLPNYISNLVSKGWGENHLNERLGALGIKKSRADIYAGSPQGGVNAYNRMVKSRLTQLEGSKYLDGLKKEIDEIDGKEEKTDADIRRKLLLLNHGRLFNLKVSMTYFYAGLVQGESGGRAISNEDFDKIWNALWGGGLAGPWAKGSFDTLQKTINNIIRRSENDSKFIGYGPKGDMSLSDYMIKLDRLGDRLIDATGRFANMKQGPLKETIKRYRPANYTRFRTSLTAAPALQAKLAEPQSQESSFFNQAIGPALVGLRQKRDQFRGFAKWSDIDRAGGRTKNIAINTMLIPLMEQNLDPNVSTVVGKGNLKPLIKQQLNLFSRLKTDNNKSVGFGDMLDYFLSKSTTKDGKVVPNFIGGIDRTVQAAYIIKFFRDLYNESKQ